MNGKYTNSLSNSKDLGSWDDKSGPFKFKPPIQSKVGKKKKKNATLIFFSYSLKFISPPI